MASEEGKKFVWRSSDPKSRIRETIHSEVQRFNMPVAIAEKIEFLFGESWHAPSVRAPKLAVAAVSRALRFGVKVDNAILFRLVNKALAGDSPNAIKQLDRKRTRAERLRYLDHPVDFDVLSPEYREYGGLTAKQIILKKMEKRFGNIAHTKSDLHQT